MKGIQYVVDEAGEKVAVLLDLHVWGELWEDFCDGIVSESRKGEPAVPLDELEREMEMEEEKAEPAVG